LRNDLGENGALARLRNGEISGPDFEASRNEVEIFAAHHAPGQRPFVAVRIWKKQSLIEIRIKEEIKKF